MVTNNLPSFLRLHVAEEPATPTPPSLTNDTFGSIASAFEVATGWSLDRDSEGLDANSNSHYPLLVKPASTLHTDSTGASAIDFDRAAQLAGAVSDLFGKLGGLQAAIWRREAELAIGVPVSPKREDEEHLAIRLEAMLRNGAEAIGCSAAGLYMLDDTTTELKLRACWGLPQEQFLQPARPLESAFAELEALIGHAVVLEDVSLLPHWKTPEPFPAAVCLPVASPTDPLGTIWFFADAVRDFTDQQVHLAEIIAGSIAAELQREVLLGECRASKQADRQIIHAMQWQHDHLPNIKPLLDDWDVSGWLAADDELAGGFYDWFVPPDGSLALALGTSEGLRVESALSAGALQANVRAHAEYPHDARQMISRANGTIWNSSAGGHTASLFYCKAIPDSGELEFSMAGDIRAILVRQSGVELIEASSLPLGVEPELNPELTRLQMSEGDVLLVLKTSSERPSLQLEISRQLRLHNTATADELLRLVRSLDPQADLAVVLRHR
ncbi:MAG: SpoIIE family protein phosphatase [Planctomycetes bacterium]|nr:SpoIIE family protein phosphatase [Planctomycetota bacterium]